jgi:predicted peptidase
MRRGLALPLAAVLAASCASGPPLSAGRHELAFAQAGERALVLLPLGVDADRGRRWPLILFLRDAAEPGDESGPVKFLAQRPGFPFILLAPLPPEDGNWSPAALDKLLDDALSRLPIDKDHLYLTGVGAGASAAYALAARSPQRFAALLPVGGAGDPAAACRLKSLPVRAYHGGKDAAATLAADRAMVDAVVACGGNAEFNLYPELGREAAALVYADQGLYNWLLRQTRGQPAVE